MWMSSVPPLVCTACTIEYDDGIPEHCYGSHPDGCDYAGSVMQLLTRMYSQGAAAASPDDFGQLVPRLWPFFRHTLSSVRMSCLRCLQALLKATSGAVPIPDQTDISWLLDELSLFSHFAPGNSTATAGCCHQS